MTKNDKYINKVHELYQCYGIILSCHQQVMLDAVASCCFDYTQP